MMEDNKGYLRSPHLSTGTDMQLTTPRKTFAKLRKPCKQNGHVESGNESLDMSSQRKLAAERFREAGVKAKFAKKIEKILDDCMTFKQIFNRYVENSTLHGFRFIFMDTFIVRRILWTILTLTMLGIFLSELKNSIQLYLEYPFTTTSTMEYIHSLVFPAISICNLNTLQHPRTRSQNAAHYYERALLPEQYRRSRTLPNIPGKTFREILRNNSPNISDIFQRCEWKSRDTAKRGIPNPCHSGNFTSYIDLHGETCYTFNGENSHTPLTLNETGLDMALKLEFDLKMGGSEPLQEMGLKVIVHDISETPLQQAGFVVSPGFQSIIELKVRKTKNLPGPYATKCGKRGLTFFQDYRQSKCFLEKLTKEIQFKCKCNSLFMEELDFSSKYSPCSLNQTINCVLPLVDRFDRKTNADCPVDCETTTYGTSLSYARFIPNVPLKSTVMEYGSSSYIQSLRKKKNASELDRYVQENVLVIQLFYQEMKEENVAQERSYDHFKLIGDVGGQLGLLLGASVLTLVEFVDLFFFVLYHQILRMYRRN